MSCYSTISDNNKVIGIRDGTFFECDHSRFNETLGSSSVELWDITKTVHSNSYLDLKDLGVLFKLSDLKSFNCRSFEDFETIKNKINKFVFSYKDNRINHNRGIFELIPTFLLKEFLETRTVVLEEIYENLQQKSRFSEIEKFFRLKAKTSCIENLKFDIVTSEGSASVDLKFAENFRFKAAHGTLNIFNMPKDKRHIIIPQEDDHFLYCADFRQFEFRTFLMINPCVQEDFNDLNLYQTLQKKYNVEKQQIIAYMYGQHNAALEKIFPTAPLLEKAEGGIFFWRKYPVALQDGVSERKNVHTIIQTISQYIYLEKLRKVLDLLKDKKSKFLYPFHDNMIFSIHKNEKELMKQIKNLLEDDVYFVKEYIGNNLLEVKEIK